MYRFSKKSQKRLNHLFVLKKIRVFGLERHSMIGADDIDVSFLLSVT